MMYDDATAVRYKKGGPNGVGNFKEEATEPASELVVENFYVLSHQLLQI